MSSPHQCKFCSFRFQAKNADFFKHYVTEDFNEYLNRKRIDSAHGNHVEMQAISELYNRPVEVYQYSLGTFIITVFNFRLNCSSRSKRT